MNWRNTFKLGSNFLKQMWQEPYFVCTTCHRCIYNQSVRCFNNQKYEHFSAKLVNLVTTFDEGYYICEDCHEHLAREIIPYQAVYHKMKIQPTPLTWQCPWRREKLLISKQILFKKVVIIHTKGEFSKIKRSACIASIETDRTCKVLLVLPRPEVSDEVIVVKLKGDVKWAHAYFLSLLGHMPHTMHWIIWKGATNFTSISLCQKCWQVKKCSNIAAAGFESATA